MCGETKYFMYGQDCDEALVLENLDYKVKDYENQKRASYKWRARQLKNNHN